MNIPRLVISGLSGGSGKTTVSLGLARALARSGLAVKTFKKGPDYIDAAWLARAARSPQGNLDPFFSSAVRLHGLFRKGAQGFDTALIEGNRGLFDGLDIEGSCATSKLALTLSAPVLLVVDCTKMTRTVAALVAGCATFEPGLHLGGVILNRTGNSRHQSMVRRAVEEYTDIPVLGVLPRRADMLIQERHMGLAGTDEFSDADSRLDDLADFAAGHIDLEAVRRLAESAPELPDLALPLPAAAPEAACSAKAELSAKPPRIGVVRDAAFWFYYQENLDALEEAGAELVFVSLLEPGPLPDLDGLYIGGGLPELFIGTLSDNKDRRTAVRDFCVSGKPVYAECGGFMYLARSLVCGGKSYPMAGVFPYDVEFTDRPQGLGYLEAEVAFPNPFHPVGTHLRGHEFHFSRLAAECGQPAANAPQAVLALTRGKGFGLPTAPTEHGDCENTPHGKPRFTGADGLTVAGTYAGYAHIYAPAAPHWAKNFILLAHKARAKQ